jgi:hypothetical protein
LSSMTTSHFLIIPRSVLCSSCVCSSITVKRNHDDNPLKTYKPGNDYFSVHYWTEIAYGLESYGWWPKYYPSLLGFLQIITGYGVEGALNGWSEDGECQWPSPDGINRCLPTKDPNHGFRADESFHPKLVSGESSSDGFPVRNCIAAEWRIRQYAFSYNGRYSLVRNYPNDNCRGFQDRLLRYAGLTTEKQ